MSPPPIRYPLPTLLALLVLSVLAWSARGLIAAADHAVRNGLDRLVSGPPVPASSEPMRDGPLVRRVLLLRDDVDAAETPDGPAVETIRRRIFADVFDVWPLQGPPTHYRIGNRRPIGWVDAIDVLPWDTRLVVMPTNGLLSISETPDGPFAELPVGSESLPIIGWEAGLIEIALWEAGLPWERVAGSAWIKSTDLPIESWGVWMSRSELLEALRRALQGPGDAGSPPLSAILGSLGSESDNRAAALAALPDVIAQFKWEPNADRLARINESWNPEARWSGLEFAAIPLGAL